MKNYQIVDISSLSIDLDLLLNIAEDAYRKVGGWFYAEPEDVIAKIGLNRTIKDAELTNEYINDNILRSINLPFDDLNSIFYKLPADEGISPIHVDYESCNILLPLHDTRGQAYACWYEWPTNRRELTNDDWELYRIDWNKYPICQFSDDLREIERYYWKQGEAVLFNTRQPHSSINLFPSYRINFVVNIYNTSFAEVAELNSKEQLFKK